MTTYNKTARDYRRLDKLENLDDWQVHHDDTDIRDWNVYAADGTKVGEVEHLIVDKDAKKVRYVEVELEDNLAAIASANSTIETRYDDGDRYIIVPIGFVQVDKDDDVLRVNRLNTSSLYGMPRYNRQDGLRPDYEINLYNYLNSSTGNETSRSFNRENYVGAPGMDADFYENTYFSSTPYTESIKDRRNRDLKNTTHHSLS